MRQHYEIQHVIVPLVNNQRNFEASYRASEKIMQYMDTNSTKELFDEFQQEYGRCRGKVYRDLDHGGVEQLGWVFEKKERYEDTKDPYIMETWITLFGPCTNCGNLVPVGVLLDVSKTPVSILKERGDISYYLPW